MDASPLKIIQISDTHLFADPDQFLLGVPTQKSLEAVLDHVDTLAKPFDLLIHTGDVAQDYSDSAYQRFEKMLSRFNMPRYCIPGNHDDIKKMARVYPYVMQPQQRHILTKHWQIILLDSHKPNAVEGFLKQSELDFLEKCLITYPEYHSIIFLHHHPIFVGSEWIDRLALSNANALWKIAIKHQTLKAIFFGHIHQDFETMHQHIACYATPSTCVQFKRNQETFGIEELPQGYRQIYLHADGLIETNVIRIESYIGDFDVNAKGY
jgi:Icc protein